MRTLAVVRVQTSSGWEKLGRGDLILVYGTITGRSRMIFFAEATAGRLNKDADVNAWLFDPMKNDKSQEKSLVVSAWARAV